LRLEIVDAHRAQAVLRNLFVPYMHELSDMAGLDVRDDGTFAFPPLLAREWGPHMAGLHPFLMRADAKLAGFALVRALELEPPTHEISEFFVLRKYRRSGVGRDTACRLFDRFPGDWEVRELPANTPAQAFWRRIIGDYTAGDFDDRCEYFEAYRREFVVQRFRSRSAFSPSPA
jgi:predicted acetyltransferase